jgi:hypothetical protein
LVLVANERMAWTLRLCICERYTPRGKSGRVNVPFIQFLPGFIVANRRAAGEIDDDGLVLMGRRRDPVDVAEHKGQQPLWEAVLDDLYRWVSKAPGMETEAL